ncbi:uncharacterized protein ATC70_000711 [Mucor velutinosus]|uniref:F-box domain-containing protein n=1 Tax=Mucor velutinosus TaxID=708070 RepID=A0AAN7DLR4_9FUNG|nr:hypothetical protein ATC70_000711 [Mucor velutinosus]
MLDTLPPELLYKVISLVPCRDLASLRLTCKYMRTFCDQPIVWKSIDLKPWREQELWKLTELKNTIDLHLSHILSIRIWGVRDSIVQYLLNQCQNLQHLTICGWTTLSDHCLRLLPSQSLKIKSLELIGSSQQTNFVSVDAYTLGNLLLHSPEMTNLVLGCEIHIHAETFITELEKTSVSSDLQSFLLASRKTWLNEHVLRLINIYPEIQKIYLLPKASIELGPMQGNNVDALLHEKLKQIMNIVPLPLEVPLLSNEEFIIYDKRFTACV